MISHKCSPPFERCPQQKEATDSFLSNLFKQREADGLQFQKFKRTLALQRNALVRGSFLSVSSFEKTFWGRKKKSPIFLPMRMLLLILTAKKNAEFQLDNSVTFLVSLICIWLFEPHKIQSATTGLTEVLSATTK